MPFLEKKIIEAHNETMVNHAKSDALKRQIARKVKDNLMAQALALYQTEIVVDVSQIRKFAL